MQFVLDYSASCASCCEAEEDANALIRYYVERIDGEKQARFLQVVTYLRIVAEEQRCAFRYEADEQKNTESFTLTADAFSFGQSKFAKTAFLLASEHFSELTVKTEGKRVVICGAVAFCE